MMSILGSVGSVMSLNLYARLGAVAVLIGGLWFADRNWQYFKGKSVGKQQGKNIVVNASNKKAGKNHDRSKKAHRRAAKPGAAKRMLGQYGR